MKYFFVFVLIFTFGFLAADVIDFTAINIDSLNVAATQAYFDGEFQKAAELYLQYMQFDVNNGSVCYNLACCYGLLGNDSLATKYVRYAFNHGFDDIQHIQTDPDFEKVKVQPLFSLFLTELKIKENKP